MTRKLALAALTILWVTTFVLNLTGCPESTWWQHGPSGRITGAITVSCQGGAFVVTVRRAYDHVSPTWVPDLRLWPLFSRRSHFYLYRQRLGDSDPMFIMLIGHEVQLWPLTILCAAYPGLAFARGPLRRYRLRRAGRCATCGYDLTGNVSGRCPECGEPVGPETPRGA